MIRKLTDQEIQERVERAQQLASTPEGRKRIIERNEASAKAVKELQRKRRVPEWLWRKQVTI